MRKGMTEESMAEWDAMIAGPFEIEGLHPEIVECYEFTLEHNGETHRGVCEIVRSESQQERRFKETRDDLASYVGGFVAYGCGWPGHEFDGDVTDPTLYLECVKCGAAKLRNQRLPALEPMPS
jgi:hypothetical protein